MYRIALLEDDLATLQNLKLYLEECKYNVVLAADSIGSFLEQIDLSKPPEVLLLDIMLGNQQNALDQIEKLRLLMPDCKIIMITGHTQEHFLFQALERGADSYFIKGSSLKELMTAIESCMNGDFYLSPKSAKQLIQKVFADASAGNMLNNVSAVITSYNLNRREQEVLNGLIEELQYKEIADRMHVSINTVRYYVVCLYRKVGVNSRNSLLKKINTD